MPLSDRHRAAAVLLTFALTAAAGWFTASPPEEKPAPRVSSLTKRPAAPSPPAPAVKTRDAAIAAFERDFGLNPDPAAETYTGERLTELCQGDYASDLPGTNEAFSYARRWAIKDPRGMFEWFFLRGQFTLPAGGANTNYAFTNTLFAEWAKHDATAAMTAALRCVSKRDRADAAIDVIETLRKTDPARAAALAAENLALFASDGLRSFRAFGEGYKDTWNFLTALPSGKERGALLAHYFDEVVRYHGDDCTRMWKEMPESLRRELVTGGFRGISLGKSDMTGEGPGAPATLEGLEDLQRQYSETSGDADAALRFLNTSGRAWVERDPAGAVTWAQQHLKGEARVTKTAQLFTYAARHDFDAALRTWQTLPDGILRARAAGRIAAAAGDSRTEEVAALFATLPPGDQAIALAERKQATPKR